MLAMLKTVKTGLLWFCFKSLNQSCCPRGQQFVPPNVIVRGDDRFYAALDFDDKDNEHEVVADLNNDGDLPHDFTADNCENLVAMLDVASSLA